MAEARAGWLGGLNYAFVDEVDEELQCPICYLPMKEPVQTKCGHRFCGQCLDKHLCHFKRFALITTSFGVFKSKTWSLSVVKKGYELNLNKGKGTI